MAQNSKTIKKYAARVETCFDDFVEEAVVSKQKSHDVAEDGSESSILHLELC